MLCTLGTRIVSFRTLLFMALFAVLMRALPAQTTAGDELNLGVDAYKAAHYDEAIGHFRKAVELDPGSIMAKAYLATALSQNVVPNLDTPENLKTAEAAIGVFQDVLAVRPHDVNSMKQVAGIYFNIKQLDEAKAWQLKVLAEDPSDAEAAYTVGVIDWTLSYQNALKALLAAGFNDDGKGNTAAPASVMDEIRQENSELVPEAVRYLSLAVQLRPTYDDAMQYLNLAYRRKADLDRDNEGALAEDLSAAQEWTRKAMEAHKAKEESRNNSGSPQP